MRRSKRITHKCHSQKDQPSNNVNPSNSRQCDEPLTSPVINDNVITTPDKASVKWMDNISVVVGRQTLITLSKLQASFRRLQEPNIETKIQIKPPINKMDEKVLQCQWVPANSLACLRVYDKNRQVSDSRTSTLVLECMEANDCNIQTRVTYHAKDGNGDKRYMRRFVAWFESHPECNFRLDIWVRGFASVEEQEIGILRDITTNQYKHGLEIAVADIVLLSDFQYTQYAFIPMTKP